MGAEPKGRLQAFAKALRAQMAAERIGVQELADHMGVSRQAVSDWRDGKSAPELRRIPELAERLGLEAEQITGLLAGRDRPAGPVFQAEVMLGAVELLEEWEQDSVEVRLQRVEAYVANMIAVSNYVRPELEGLMSGLRDKDEPDAL